MKTAFSTLVLCFLISFTSFAQFRKGAVLLGGYVDANSDKKDYDRGYYDEDNRTFVSVSPVAGVFISNRWMVGLRPSIQYQHSFTASRDSSNKYKYDDRNTTYGLGINARYYMPINEKFMFFANLSGVGYSLTKGHTKNERFDQPELSFDHKYQSNSYNIGLFAGLGVTYFLTPKIGLEATMGQIGYGFTKTKSKTLGEATESEPSTSKNFRGSFNINLSYFGLGLMFYLAKQ